MFSSTTIAASSTMPVAKASPASEITLSDRPAADNTTKVASSEIGIAKAMIKVARHWRRKSHSTPMARRAITPVATSRSLISILMGLAKHF